MIYFRLIQDRLSLGGVRIHLHNTNSRRQVQGRALLPDEKTAPIWFVENVLKKHFIKLSEEKSIDISNCNQAVRKMVTSQLTKDQTPHTCGDCNEIFNGRSSPQFCSQCSLFLHKFKCVSTLKHACYVRKRTLSCNKIPEQEHSP